MPKTQYRRITMALSVLILIAAQHLYAGNQTDSLKPLQTGDKMPDIYLGTLLNYKGSGVSINDFRGKLLILDVWSLGCGSCIAAFPKMEALQKEFDDKIQIITVTSNSPVQLEAFFSKTTSKARMTTLPSIIQDSVIRLLFPHKYVPHHIWIAADGTVLAITNGSNASSKTIAALLNGERPAMNPKIDLDRNFFKEHYLWEFANGKAPNPVLYHSILIRFIDSIAAANTIIEETDSLPGTFRRCIPNTSMASLFKYAYNDTRKRDDKNYYDNNRIEWNLKNMAVHFPPADNSLMDEWKKEHYFSYEQILPIKMADQSWLLMQQDLNRYFEGLYGVSAAVKLKKVKCYILVGNGNKNMITKGGRREHYYPKSTEEPVHRFTNYPFKSVRNVIASEFATILLEGSNPFINETDFNGNVDFLLDTSQKNIESLKRQLNYYGFDIIEDYRTINMLVIEER